MVVLNADNESAASIRRPSRRLHASSVSRPVVGSSKRKRKMATEENGNENFGFLKPTVSSTEDLSEYTDADESISAPTEFLAEFLSAVMMKDYLTALKYCKLILQYEPNNATAKEFYPLILEKLQQINQDEESDNESEDEVDENSSSSSSSSGSDSSSSENSSEDQEDDEEAEEELNKAEDKCSKGSSNGDNTTGSYSSLEDDEAELEQLVALAAKYKIDNVDLENGNKIPDTNHVITVDNMSTNVIKNSTANSTGSHQLPFGSSDSESPTEPVSQQTIAMLRSRVIPN